MTASEFVDALQAEGVTVVEVADWRHHNRNSKGTWGPVHGVMIHHTVTKGSTATVDICYDGYSELPGPLCHGVITKDGRVHLVGNGRANHAGGGDPDVLNAVIDESYGDKPPATNQYQGSAGAVDGNAHFYGFECENFGDGKDPWPAAQLEAIERVAAALCRQHGWTPKSLIGHLEWSSQKSDPRGFTMPAMRARVAKRLGAKPAPPKTPTPPKVPVKPVVSLKHVVAAARRDPGGKQGATTYKAEVRLVEDALVELGYLDKRWADGSFGTYTVAAYARLQRHLGYAGTAADGIPGAHSIRWLGLRTGLFTDKD
jgi:hypothetical protein